MNGKLRHKMGAGILRAMPDSCIPNAIEKSNHIFT
jgi:hypothetical protein